MAKTIEKLYDMLYAVVMVICKLLLIADVGITSYAVLGRYVPFIKDPAWSEEIVLTCMIYMALLSAALAIRTQTHIRMTSLDTYLPKRVCQVLDILADILIIAFALLMVFEGFKSASKFMKIGYTSLPNLPRFWLYAPIPFSGVAILLFQLEVLYKHIMVLAGKGETDEH